MNTKQINKTTEATTVETEVKKEIKVRKTKKKLKKEELYLQVNGMQYDIKKYVNKIKEKQHDITNYQFILTRRSNGLLCCRSIHDKLEMEWKIE